MNATRDEKFSLDSNVLVYAFDRTAQDRHEVASRIVLAAARQECILTLQSLGEFYAVVARKRLGRLDEAIAQAQDWLTIFPTAPSSPTALAAAMRAAQSGRFQFWDAMLLATAGEAGCGTVISEDMANGARLGGVHIRHPFAGTGARFDIAPAVKALLRLG